MSFSDYGKPGGSSSSTSSSSSGSRRPPGSNSNSNSISNSNSNNSNSNSNDSKSNSSVFSFSGGNSKMNSNSSEVEYGGRENARKLATLQRENEAVLLQSRKLVHETLEVGSVTLENLQSHEEVLVDAEVIYACACACRSFAILLVFVVRCLLDIFVDGSHYIIAFYVRQHSLLSLSVYMYTYLIPYSYVHTNKYTHT